MAGLKQLQAGFMDGGRVVIDAPNDGQAVSNSRRRRQELADANAGDARRDRSEWSAHFGRRVRLRVPCLQLAGSADEHEKNARSRRLRLRARVTFPEREPQSAGADGANSQDVTASDRCVHRFARWINGDADHPIEMRMGYLRLALARRFASAKRKPESNQSFCGCLSAAREAMRARNRRRCSGVSSLTKRPRAALIQRIGRRR